jgi:hypothetical protein
MACWLQWKVPLSEKTRRPLGPGQHYSMAPTTIITDSRIAVTEMVKRRISSKNFNPEGSQDNKASVPHLQLA